MSSGSLKDTLKALNNTFSAPETSNTPPVELQVIIEAFLEINHDIDDYESQRLHDELLTIHRKYVADWPEKHGLFISVLSQLRPAIRGDDRLADWWDLTIEPTINAVGHKRDEVDDAREFLLGVMVFDPEDDTDGEKAEVSARFCRRLLQAYLAKTKIPSAGIDSISPVDEFIAHELESILVAFGRKKPKELLEVLDELLVNVDHRAQILGLLSAFVRTQPPHLYYVLETPLIENLLTCLLIDTSNTVVELALTVLIMFLPHVTNSIKQHLPRLFLIYVRVLCWDMVAWNNVTADSTLTPGTTLELFLTQCGEDLAGDEDPWTKFDHNFDASRKSAPPLVHFYTFLYGLFPLNFTSFLRKSRKWLKAYNFPRADEFDFDQSIIHDRSGEYQKVHLLHPNFYLTTQEEELNDSRYLNSDPADVVTDCMSLCVAVSSSLNDPGPPPTTKLPDLPSPPPSADAASGTMVAEDEPLTPHGKLSSEAGNRDTKASIIVMPPWHSVEQALNSRNNSQTSLSKTTSKSSTAASPLLTPYKPYESPTLPPTIPHGHTIAELPGSEPIFPLPPGYAGTAGTDQTDSRLETFAQTLSSGRAGNVTNLSADYQSQSMASLQREVMLLRNDLNFERYLKHQHLAHIGQLQRKNLKEVTAEAQTQNLINTNRTLKAKLNKADELNTQLKKETATSRGQSRKVEDQISTRYKALREEQKIWKAEEEKLRHELQRLQEDNSRLRRIVDESDARELRSQHQLRALQSDVAEVEFLRREVEKLRENLREAQSREHDPRLVHDEREFLRSQLESANLKLASRDTDNLRTRDAYERKIAELESRLYDGSSQALGQSASDLPPAIQQMIDSALAANHAKLQHLKKAHSRLHDRYIELEMRNQELERERERGLSPPGRAGAHSSIGGRSTPSTDRRPSSRTSTAFHGRFAPSTLPEVVGSEDEYYNDYASPHTPGFDSFNPPPSAGHEMSGAISGHSRRHSLRLRPARFESMTQQSAQQALWNSTVAYGNGSDGSPGRSQLNSAATLGSGYEGGVSGSGSGNISTEGGFIGEERDWESGDGRASREGSRGKDGVGAGVVKPESKVRVYGRGGAQNIGKKAKDKEKEKDAKSKDNKKSSGFKGLRGIM